MVSTTDDDVVAGEGSEPDERRKSESPRLEDTFQYDWNGQIRAGLEKLADLSDELELGVPRPVRVRDFIALFGYSKRGAWLLRGIEIACNILDLKIEPALDEVPIDGEVNLILDLTLESEPHESDGKEGDHAASPPGPPVARDLVKLGDLPSARLGVASVKPSDTLKQAWTLMIMRGFSQLPVMGTEYRVDGVVSWNSIARCVVHGKQVSADALVSEHMFEAAQQCPSNRPLLAAMPLIIEHEFVLVKDAAKNKVCGIVTTNDLAKFLREKYEPFSILGEIEQGLRAWIASKLDPETIRQVRDENSPLGPIESVDDLNFGEYRAIIDRPENWGRLGVVIDRPTFVRELEKVNGIRNDVMHFDGNDEDEHEEARVRTLRAFLDGLKGLELVK